MPKNPKTLAVLIFFLQLLVASCVPASRYALPEHEHIPGSGVYLSGHPYQNTSGYLEQMLSATKRITSTSYYTSYFFHPSDAVHLHQLNSLQDLERLSRRSEEKQTTISGTAVIVHNRFNRVGMITPRHIITSPDTLLSYADPQTGILESFTIKTDQINWLIDTPYMGAFDVVISDENTDLALIGSNINPDELEDSIDEVFPVFPFPLGSPQNLRAGSFIYSIGYPRGYPMVTSGMVSYPNRDRHHAFITDINFNPGLSGGALVAINGNVPAFEWVGITRSGSLSREWFLVPDSEQIQTNLRLIPYSDNIYAEQKSLIDYGVTLVIPSSRITEFFRTHMERLSYEGYNLRPWVRGSGN